MKTSFCKLRKYSSVLSPPRRLETGFSMLEAVVVVGVLLALAVGGFFAYGPVVENAKIAKVRSIASEVHTAVLVASSDGDPATTPQDVIDAWNASSDKIRVEILEQEAATAAMTTAAAVSPDNADICVQAVHIANPAIKARMGSCSNVSDGTNQNDGANPVSEQPDMDGDGIPDSTDPDMDGDGIPNETDEDADGNGIPDDYVPGGAITEPDGTPYNYAGTFTSSRVTNSGNSVVGVFNAPKTAGKNVSIHFIATCKPTDAPAYEVNTLNGFSTSSTTADFGVTFSSCGSDKVIKYVLKPLTHEAMSSGAISNPEYAGAEPYRNTVSGGWRWSEYDGHTVLGTMKTAYVNTDAKLITSSIDYINQPWVRNIAVDLKYTCVATDRSTYKGNVLVIYPSVAGQAGTAYQHTTVCSSGDVISEFSFEPVKGLRSVTNPSVFDGYSVTGSFTWTEANGYNTEGNLAVLTRSFVNNGGNVLTFNYDYTSFPFSRKLALQVENTCVRVDKTTYTKNTLQYVTTTANTAGVAYDHPALCASGEVISAYKISPVTAMRDAATPIGFAGFTTTGTTIWTEANGYYTDNDLAVLTRNFVNNGGNVLTLNYDYKSAPAARTLSLEVKNTCVRPDKTTYENHTLQFVKTTANTTGVAFSHPALCLSGEVISAYQITPVTALSKLSAPSGFTGFSATGSASWTEADGYYTDNNLAVLGRHFVNNGGNVLTLNYDYKSAPAARTLTLEVKNTCVRPDKSTYEKHTLQFVKTIAGTAGVAYDHPALCLSGEVISAYQITPVTALSKVPSPSGFTGFSATGSASWTEANGYYTDNDLATHTNSYVATNGYQVSASFSYKNAAAARKMTFEVKNTCLKADGTNYSKHSLQFVTTVAGQTGTAWTHPVLCATGETITAYEITPVTALSKVPSPSGFSGFSTVGGKNWVR